MPESNTYVLVHGAFHGGWCWRDVAARLRGEGHTVHTPTQTGLGERAHLLSPAITLDTFIEDVTRVIDCEELERVILVGHSFGGSTISGVADRMPERLRHLVYLDAIVLESGQAPLDGMAPDRAERYRALAEQTGGLGVPPPPCSYFDVTDPGHTAWLERHLTPQPFSVYSSRLVLKHPLGNGVPATYIAAAEPYFRTTASSREAAKARPGWNYQEIRTGHDAMVTAPDDLAQMLAAIG